MCVVSFVGGQFHDNWQKTYPWYEQVITAPAAKPSPYIPIKDFEQLKREVEILKDLLLGAKEYDRKNNEPDCEVEEKMVKLKKVAEIVGIDLDDVLKSGASV